MTTMLETLNETVAAYTSKTRAVEIGGCRYFTNGRCCAIGRCMIDPEKYKDYAGDAESFQDLDSLLKPEYRGFPIDFWLALQYLHDIPMNWNNEGLSENGKTTVERIKKRFKL